MNITNVKSGDVVECNVRGIRFFATVVEINKGEVQVQPHSRQINHFHIKSNQVVGHYRKTAASQ